MARYCGNTSVCGFCFSLSMRGPCKISFQTIFLHILITIAVFKKRGFLFFLRYDHSLQVWRHSLAVFGLIIAAAFFYHPCLELVGMLFFLWEDKVQEMIKHLLIHMPLILYFVFWWTRNPGQLNIKCCLLFIVIYFFLGVSCFSNYKDILDYEFW